MSLEQIPTPLDMITDVHRPAADGRRPLIVGRNSDSLWCGQTEQRLACHLVAQSATFGEAIPDRCLRVIEPGRFYLVHQRHSLATGEAVGRIAYCAPCAIVEWQAWLVSEAT